MDGDRLPDALLRINLLVAHRYHLAAQDGLEEPRRHVRIGVPMPADDLRATKGPIKHNRSEHCTLH